MAKSYIAMRDDGREIVTTSFPIREVVKDSGIWNIKDRQTDDIAILRKGTIEKIYGSKLTWDDEPIELEMSLLDVTSILSIVE